MIKARDLKKSSVIDLDGVPHTIDNITQQSPTARAGAPFIKSDIAMSLPAKSGYDLSQ